MYQKLKPYLIASLFLLSIAAAPLMVSRPASAATAQPPGTCFYNGPDGSRVASCKSMGITASQKDTNGHAVSYSKCYEVDASTSTETIVQVNCDGSQIGGNKAGTAMCYDDSTKKTVKCISCPDGSQAATSADCQVSLGSNTGKYQCGGGPAIRTAINIGCRGKGNPIMDLTFAVIRFLSAGVGIVIVGSMIVAGIQYTSSQGDPQAASAAKNRIRSNIIALMLFVFAYAILNYILPGAFLK